MFKKGAQFITDSLAINTNGNSVDPNQTENINIKGSNVSVTGGDLTIASKGNVTIENAVNSTLVESSGKKRSENVASFNRSTDYVEKALASNVSATNVNISSLGDTIIQGSNIKTDNNLIIGSFTVASNPDGSYQKDANGNYVTTSGTTVDNLIIRDADLKEFHDSQKGKGFVGAAGVAMRVAPYALAPLQVVANLADEYMRIFYPDALQNIVRTAYGFTILDKVADKMAEQKISTETQTRTEKSTSFASNINVGNSMMTNSVGDTLIKGSNLNIGTDTALVAAGGGNLLANALGSFTVTAGTNTQSTESSSSYETAGKFHSNLSVSHVNYKAGVSKDWTETGNESDSTTLAQSNLNIAGSSLINTTDQFALIASNMVTAKSTDIVSKDNLNISDGKNTQSTSAYTKNLNLDTGIQVGNAYADAAWAVVDAAKAAKAVKDAYDKLNKIEELYKEDQASSKAVERAKLQVVLALVNSGLSAAAAMQAVGNAAAAGSSSLGTGFYGSVYANITKSKSTTSTELSQSIASNLISGDSLSLTSGTKDINITGSNVSSQNGDLNLTAMLGNLNVKAGETTYSQSSKFNSQSLGGSVGNNGFSANIGMGQGESSLDQTTFTNSQLVANNGTLKVNTAQDTNIIGANLAAKDIDLTVGGNLTVKSKQNLLESDAYNIGLNIGISGGKSGPGGSIGGNIGDSFQSRAWTDQLTSIIGTNSVKINTTKNTDIVGALIANKGTDGSDLGNLLLNTGSLTYSDLKNYNNSESNQFGMNLSVGKNPNNPTANGSLALNLAMNGNESSSDTKATIGSGNINIGGTTATSNQTAGLNRDIAQVEQNKRDVLTSDFDASLKIDLRLIAAAGNLMIGDTKAAGANWNSYAGDTVRGAKITGYAIAIPTTGIYNYATNSDLTLQDTLYATGKNYSHLYNLAYNPSIKATDLVGEGKLVSYDGNSLEDSADAKSADGFYDRRNNVAAVNADSNQKDNQLAGTLAHEGVHREMNLSGRTYNGSEEVAAHMVGDFVGGAWDSFQADNTTLRASVPGVSYSNNDYLNNVVFGQVVNPLRDSVIVQNMTKNFNNFGPRWKDPVTNKSTQKSVEGKDSRPHQGNDLAATKGSIINSAFDGKVTDSRAMKGYGNTVVVEGKDPTTGNKIWALYGHMSEPSKLSVGTSVMEGQLIGLVGNTGSSEGNHLHFGINAGNSSGSIDFKNGWTNPSEKNFGKYENLQETPAYQQGKSQ